MMEPSFSIRTAELSDAEQLGIIGPAIYAESYGHMWSDAAAYAQRLRTFGEAAVEESISRPDTKTWLIECERRSVGFLSLVLGAPDPIEGRTDGAEVPRIYLLAPARGKRLAAKLFNEAHNFARMKGANHLWLDAMTEAPWAWQTYRKWGFRKIGTATFPEHVKPEFSAMIVMRRPCSEDSLPTSIL